MEQSYSNLALMNRYRTGHWRHHPTLKPRQVFSQEQELELTPAREGWSDAYLQQLYPMMLYKPQTNRTRFPYGYSFVVAKTKEEAVEFEHQGYLTSERLPEFQVKALGPDDIDEAAEAQAVGAELRKLGAQDGAMAMAILKERDELKAEVASLKDAVQQLLEAHRLAQGENAAKVAGGRR